MCFYLYGICQMTQLSTWRAELAVAGGLGWGGKDDGEGVLWGWDTGVS